MEVCRKLGNIKLENTPYTEVSPLESTSFDPELFDLPLYKPTMQNADFFKIELKDQRFIDIALSGSGQTD